MMKYHFVGVKSQPNYVPMFFGINHKKCKKRHISIFQEYNQEGYVTIDMEMAGNYGKRFYCNMLRNVTSFDHSLQILSFQREFLRRRYGSLSRCLGGKQIHKYAFKYIHESLKYYSKYNQPVMAFQSFMDSHDVTFSSSPRLDKDIAFLLSNLSSDGILSNTIVILSSDHGFHYGKFKNTKFGVVDHKLPLLTFVLYITLDNT